VIKRCDQELSFRRADYLGRCPLVPRMAQKEHDRRPEPLKPEEAAELERALQSDDIAPAAEFVGARHCLALSPHARLPIEGGACVAPTAA
jgi:hypothetical protein